MRVICLGVRICGSIKDYYCDATWCIFVMMVGNMLDVSWISPPMGLKWDVPVGYQSSGTKRTAVTLDCIWDNLFGGLVTFATLCYCIRIA